MRQKQEIWQWKETHSFHFSETWEKWTKQISHFIDCLSVGCSQNPDKWQSTPAFITGKFWSSPKGRKLSGGRRALEHFLLSVTNFTLCWEKSTETLDFPACHALLLNTKRLVHVLNAPCKQLWLRNVLTIPTCSIAKWQPGKTPAGRQDNAHS